MFFSKSTATDEIEITYQKYAKYQKSITDDYNPIDLITKCYDSKINGVPTLSDESNFDVMGRKFVISNFLM